MSILFVGVLRFDGSEAEDAIIIPLSNAFTKKHYEVLTKVVLPGEAMVEGKLVVSLPYEGFEWHLQGLIDQHVMAVMTTDAFPVRKVMLLAQRVNEIFLEGRTAKRDFSLSEDELEAKRKKIEREVEKIMEKLDERKLLGMKYKYNEERALNRRLENDDLDPTLPKPIDPSNESPETTTIKKEDPKSDKTPTDKPSGDKTPTPTSNEGKKDVKTPAQEVKKGNERKYEIQNDLKEKKDDKKEKKGIGGFFSSLFRK